MRRSWGILFALAYGACHHAAGTLPAPPDGGAPVDGGGAASGDPGDGTGAGGDMALGAPHLEIAAPTDAQPFGAPFAVVASARAADGVASVIATLDGKDYPLSARDGSASLFDADGLAPLADGHYTLTVTLRTRLGYWTSAVVAIDYLTHAPKLTVGEPRQDAAGIGGIHVDANCTSPLPGCIVRAAFDSCSGTTVASAAEQLTTTMQRPASNDRVGAQTVCLQATDRLGHVVNAVRRVHIERAGTPYTRLYDASQEIVAANFEGPDWQLLLWESDWPERNDGSGELDDTTAAYLEIYGGAPVHYRGGPLGPFQRGIDQAWVTPAGNVLLEDEYVGGLKLARWPAANGLPEDLTSQPPSAVKVHGEWAAWSQGSDLYALNLADRTKAAVRRVGTGGSIDVGPNGVAAWATWRDASCVGGDITLGDAIVTTQGLEVHTDGALVAYAGGCVTPLLYLFDGTQSAPTPFHVYPDYLLAHGWLAAVDSDQEPLELWRRAPDGSYAVVGQAQYPHKVEAVGPDGSIMITSKGTRQLSDAAGVQHALGSTDGHAYWAPDGWKIVLGRSVFQVSP